MLLAIWSAAAQADDGESMARVLAPGWQRLEYPAPTPGTYELPPLGIAPDGDVLDDSGRARRLYDVFDDEVVILSFIYTSCPDINGCPLASHVMERIQRRLGEDAGLARRVRLVSLSFDPEHDTPEVMRRYGQRRVRPPIDWQFLTTSSNRALQPLLRGFGQSIRREYNENGRPIGTISHILRVFLIDPARRIRNIYSSALLHPDTLWSDVATVLAGSPAKPAPTPRPAAVPRALAGVPLGLPPLPPGAPPTEEAVALGRKLFFDRRLSRNGTISCAMCHVPEQGFTSNEMATAVGIEGRTVRRNAPTIYNVAYAERLFHDAREDRLEQQVWGPLLAANEMGNASIGVVLDRLGSLPDYAGRFAAVYDGTGPSMETVGWALAAYERTLLSADSPFDRWRAGTDPDALSPAARRGFALFSGRAGCTACHRIAAEDALFTDQELHDTGVGYRQTMAPPEKDLEVEVAPGVRLRVETKTIAAASEPRPSDLGRYEITERPEDRWKYKTPILRNVALTAPYMHDGSIASLEGVVDFYAGGGVPHALLDERIHPLDLDERDRSDLVAFLRSLTGSDVDAIVAEALAEPVGEPGSSTGGHAASPDPHG